MRRHSAFFALFLVLVGLAFVTSIKADSSPEWEWETQTRYSHVRSITWSGDSQYIAATSFDDDENGVRHSLAEMWNTTLKDHRTFGTDDAQPISAALNQDGSQLFTGLATGEIALWDTESGALLQRIPAHKTAPELEISDDRKWLVSWEKDSVIIWNTNTFERHWMIKNPSHTRDSVDFVFVVVNRESDTVAVGNSAGVILIYDLESKRHISSLVTGENGKPYGAFFKYSGELTLSYNSSTIKLCDYKTAQCNESSIETNMYFIASGYYNSADYIAATSDGNVYGRTTSYDVIFFNLKTKLYNVSDIVVSPHEVYHAIGAYPGRLIITHSPLCACSLQFDSDLL